MCLAHCTQIYHALRDVPFHKLNLILFTSCLAGYLLCALLSSTTHDAPVPPGASPRDFIAAIVILALRAGGDLLMLATLRRALLPSLPIQSELCKQASPLSH
ncbi:hypothetical protein FB451DRAFT_1240189 [Mycena latifolia]|nr:hypothetical protein FB451DRAFT_1240189 [Mycena latifolia]